MSKTGLRAAAVRRTQLLAGHLMSTSAASNTEEPVLFESDGALRKYVLNRPKKLNSLDQEMLNLLRPQIEEWSNSDLCRVIVGTGVGRAFCAGGDVRKVTEDAAQDSTRPKALEFFQKEFELDYILSAMEKPYVAVMDGITMGGGVGLSINAPFRIASEKTVFAMPETKIGYSPDVGGSYFLSRMDGSLGTYLGLSGETVSGKAVFQLGLATHYVPSDRIPGLIQKLASLDDASYESIDRLIEEHSADVQADDGVSNHLTGDIRVALDRAFGANDVESIFTRLQEYIKSENEAVRDWAGRTLDALKMRSPTSLRVALHAIQKGKSLTLIEALRMELRISTAYCSGASPDFRTGVTAVLVDKTKDLPAWSPPTLAEIAPEKVMTDFFSSDSPFFKNTPSLNVPQSLLSSEINPQRFALPSEEEIGHVVQGSHSSSSSFAVSLPELISRFVTLRDGKHGVREKVQEVVKRRCQLEKDSSGAEWVSWRH